MKTYPDELKSSIIKKLLPPINAYIPELSKETGIPKDTLYAWRIRYRRRGQAPKGQQPNMTTCEDAHGRSRAFKF